MSIKTGAGFKKTVPPDVTMHRTDIKSTVVIIMGLLTCGLYEAISHDNFLYVYCGCISGCLYLLMDYFSYNKKIKDRQKGNKK